MIFPCIFISDKITKNTGQAFSSFSDFQKKQQGRCLLFSSFKIFTDLLQPASSREVPSPKSSLVHWRVPALLFTTQFSLTSSPSLTVMFSGCSRNSCCPPVTARRTEENRRNSTVGVIARNNSSVCLTQHLARESRRNTRLHFNLIIINPNAITNCSKFPVVPVKLLGYPHLINNISVR